MKILKYKRNLLAATALAFAPALSTAATITEYTFATNTSATTTATNTSATGFAAVGANFGSNGRSSFNGGSYFARYGNETFDQNSGYIGFTVTIDPSFELDLTSLSFNYDVEVGDNIGSFETLYSVRTSADSFGADLAGSYTTNPLSTVGNTRNLSKSATFDLTGSSFQNLTGSFEVRIYGTITETGAPTSSTQFINRYDNVLLEGSASVIPEPSSFALIGLGCLGFVLRRRRA